MTEQITFHPKPNHDLSREEWRSFVEEQHGKYRGVNTDEGIRALRKHIESVRGDVTDGEGDQRAIAIEDVDVDEPLLEQLIEEMRALRQENEKLREQISVLLEQIPSRVSPTEGVEQTKNAGQAGSADSSDTNQPTPAESTATWSWEEYDTEASSGQIPSAALECIHEVFDPVTDDPSGFEGRELPRINPKHVDMPGQPADARVAIVAGILKHEGDSMQLGEIIARTMDLLDNDTKYYVKRHLVEGSGDLSNEHGVLDWLAGPHPDPKQDTEWVTRMDAYDALRAEVGDRAVSEGEDIARMFVGAALGYPQHMATGAGGLPTVATMTDEFETYRERLVELGILHGVAAEIVSKALGELEGGGVSSGRLSRVPGVEPWETFFDEWHTTPEDLVRWWEQEHASRLAEKQRKRVVTSLTDVAPAGDPQPPSNRGETGSDRESVNTIMAKLRNATPKEPSDEPEASDETQYQYGSRKAALEHKIRELEEESRRGSGD